MKHFKLYYTSDVHGYLLPTDYIQSGNQSLGMANAAYNFHKDGNTIIIDGGDMYQGSPMLQYLQQHQDIDAVTTAMNLAGYDYVTLGNHDFNYGYHALEKHLSQLNATVIAENVTDSNGETLYPAQIKTLADGTTVGLIGLVTDYINIWENPEHLAGIRIESPRIKAQKTVMYLRENADVVVGVYHGGYERDLVTGQQLSQTDENIAYQLTEQLDLDILLTGHQHGNVAPQVVNGVLTLQMPNQARMYAEIIGTKHDTEWVFNATTASVGHTARPDIITALAPLNERVQRWLDQPITQLTSAIPLAQPLALAQFGNDILQWIAHVELSATQADIALVSLNNNPSELPANLTLRQILQNYPFDNTLVTKRVSGLALKTALEHTADYFVLESGKLTVNPSWLYPKVEHYNYDLAFGISYTIDVKQPVGQRITELSFDGQAVADSDLFTVAMNSYRAAGGGDYTAYRDAETIFSGDETIQDMLVSYFKAHNQLPETPKLQLKVIY